MVNVKPSRAGGLRSLLDTYDWCAERGITAYGGGQWELGCGRGQIQYLASLFHPDAPNDVAPSGYNDPSVPGGAAGEPAQPRAVRRLAFAGRRSRLRGDDRDRRDRRGRGLVVGAERVLEKIEQPHVHDIPLISSAKTLAAAVGAALLLLAPAARAETVTVGTGDLRAQIETDPWSLAFIDASGREVVGESRAMPIGYRTATGWAGATKAVSVVRDGPAIVADVETAVTTPLGAIAGRAAARPDRARGAGHARDRGHAGRAGRGLGARDRIRRRHDRALLRPGRAARARRPPRREPRRDLRRRRPVLPGRGARRAVRVRPAAGLPAARRRDLLPDPVGALLGRLRRARRERGDGVPRLQRRAHLVGRGHDARPTTRASSRRAPANLRLRVFGGGSPAATLRRFTRYAGRQPAPAGAVGVGRVVPARRHARASSSASSRSCARPTRRCR